MSGTAQTENTVRHTKYGRIRGMVIGEGGRRSGTAQTENTVRHTKYGRIRGMVIGEGGRRSGTVQTENTVRHMKYGRIRGMVFDEGWSSVRDGTNRKHCPSHEIWSYKRGVNRLETSVEMTVQGQTPPWETLHLTVLGKKDEAYPLGT